MMALDGLTIPWDAFVQTIYTRTKKLKFDSLREECIQEEARVVNHEALLARDDDQALATLMQEHSHLIKRVSAWRKKRQLDDASTKILNHLDICCAAI
jgi:hypothetical protein